MAQSPKIRVGTSGWHYAHWRGPFYPASLRNSDMFGYYAERFDIVELNNTFYRLPTENAVIDWRESSPPGFKYAVKGSRYLTHMKKLRDPEPGLERFFQRADLLQNKLGPILFQLPPHWNVDPGRLHEFLKALPSHNRYAFEFRDTSWHNPRIYDLLGAFNAAYCIFELSGFQSPLQITADFTYIRLHGPGGSYQGNYNRRILLQWAQRLIDWDLADAFVFFDNDENAYAAANALILKEVLDSLT